MPRRLETYLRRVDISGFPERSFMYGKGLTRNMEKKVS
jgi:hypothetical protein